MKIIEVPVFNEDGSVQATHILTAEETQVLLQFALNFLLSSGWTIQTAMQKFREVEEKEEAQPPSSLN